ncbi:MAG: hypothetical protein N2Z79_01575 [Candidatus Omnitrophica bacterium]|nr:hypothetical protein [Candidatus Omnitrophota bacterium]
MIRKIFFIILFLILFTVICSAQKEFKSSYFKIHLYKGVDILDLTKKLDISSGYLLGSYPLDNAEIMLTRIIDAIFLETSDILGIHLPTFKGEIKIFYNYEELKNLFREIFERELNTFSFYMATTNTIYIDAQNIKPEILAHEMAHALISRYFVVLPPPKLQEILAKYVEYKIRKLSQVCVE